MKHYRRKDKEKLGRDGEKAVARSIRQALGKTPYHLYNNLYFLAENGHPFQVDHLILTPVGLLVVESKHWSGIVYGDAKGDHWSYVPRSKGVIKRFYNPITQNQKHVEKLQAVLGDGLAMVSCVVFTQPRGEQHVAPRVPDNMFSLAQFDVFLAAWKKHGPILAPDEMETWHRVIMGARKIDSETARQQQAYAKEAKNIGRAIARREYYGRERV